MDLIGYRPLKTWNANKKIRNLSTGNGKIICCGNAICDISKTAAIKLDQDLILGSNLRKGSNAETYLKIKENGKLNVKRRYINEYL